MQVYVVDLVDLMAAVPACVVQPWVLITSGEQCSIHLSQKLNARRQKNQPAWLILRTSTTYSRLQKLAHNSCKSTSSCILRNFDHAEICMSQQSTQYQPAFLPHPAPEVLPPFLQASIILENKAPSRRASQIAADSCSSSHWPINPATLRALSCASMATLPSLFRTGCAASCKVTRHQAA